MRRKTTIILLILVILLPTTLFAANKVGISFVNYAQLNDLKEGNSDFYVPGLRLEFFFNNYLGISGDALLLYSNPDDEVYLMMYFVDAVLRGPFGMIEPYVALGPAYLGVIAGEESAISDSLGFNVRAGLDVNILKWLSVGAEFNFLVDDLKTFFEDIGSYFSEEGLKSSLIGLTAKIRF
ncbi:MAG: outer membrane beta-barrel protein [Sphaerochaetaceae bacterium]